MEALRILSVTITPSVVRTGQSYLIKAVVTTITPDGPKKLPVKLSSRLGGDKIN